MKILSVTGAASTAALALVAAAPSTSSTLQNILANTDGSDLYHYPTDLTRDIVPKPIHSHNDYWRPLPFYTALSHGCTSTEADIWLFNHTLHVGHTRSALTATRTLQSLYISPLLDLLRRQNPTTPYNQNDPPTKNGVFDVNAAQTLYLFIDVKTAGDSTWPSVIEALEPLRSAGYLSTFNASNNGDPSGLTPGPITIIGTGNAPRDLIASTPSRSYFCDADLASLTDTTPPTLAPIASTSFEAQFGPVRNLSHPLNDSQLALLRSQIGAAHARGIMARYWDTPAWPIALRDRVWRMLWDEGVDFINADDVGAAAEMF
ncbi:hypothetical protein MMC08_005260 [Hypocenomyce scalaris]|nr:hypothetical protein [Hypocenomyce scalaris]